MLGWMKIFGWLIDCLKICDIGVDIVGGVTLFATTYGAKILQFIIVFVRTVNSGAYGSLLVGHECITGRYPLTESLLQLMATISEVIIKCSN